MKKMYFYYLLFQRCPSKYVICLTPAKQRLSFHLYHNAADSYSSLWITLSYFPIWNVANSKKELWSDVGLEMTPMRALTKFSSTGVHCKSLNIMNHLALLRCSWVTRGEGCIKKSCVRISSRPLLRSSLPCFRSCESFQALAWAVF